jgi:hypothetical protein
MLTTRYLTHAAKQYNDSCHSDITEWGAFEYLRWKYEIVVVFNSLKLISIKDSNVDCDYTVILLTGVFIYVNYNITWSNVCVKHCI